MSWQKVKLSEVCAINIGKTPSRANSEYWGAGKPWLSIADMSQGLLISDTKEQITEKAIKETNIRLVPQSTVLFSFKLSIGKIGITQKPLYTNEAIAALPIKDETKLRANYLVHALSQIDATKTTDRAVMGATLNKAKLEELEILLPPLEEQKRIAATLDKADAIRRKRQQAIKLADEFLRAVFLDMFGDPVTNPKGWEVKKLKEIASKIGSGSTPTGGKESYLSDGISLIRSLNIHDNEFRYKDLAFISDQQAKKLTNVIVEKNDVLLNITGASVCRCAIVPENVLPARVNQHVAIIRTKSMNPIYLMHLLISKSYKHKLLLLAGSGATREALTKEQIENLEVPCPPNDLQNRFQEIESKISEFTKRLDIFADDELFNSLSQNAFSE